MRRSRYRSRASRRCLVPAGHTCTEQSTEHQGTAHSINTIQFGLTCESNKLASMTSFSGEMQDAVTSRTGLSRPPLPPSTRREGGLPA